MKKIVTRKYVVELSEEERNRILNELTDAIQTHATTLDKLYDLLANDETSER